MPNPTLAVAHLALPRPTPAKRCNICGGCRFRAGPAGRLSRGGTAPRCCRCLSLERHRQIRQVFARIGLQELSVLGALQLSPDNGVDPGWFRVHELSVFGAANSLDLEAIARPDACYDLVICNHVLEHVADDRQGFRELLRILRPAGFLQFTVPSPHCQARTEDWGYARPESNYHFRGYGADLVERFRAACPDALMLVVEAFDPVTGRADFIYLSTRSECRFNLLKAHLSAAGQSVDSSL